MMVGILLGKKHPHRFTYVLQHTSFPNGKPSIQSVFSAELLRAQENTHAHCFLELKYHTEIPCGFGSSFLSTITLSKKLLPRRYNVALLRVSLVVKLDLLFVIFSAAPLGPEPIRSTARPIKKKDLTNKACLFLLLRLKSCKRRYMFSVLLGSIPNLKLSLICFEVCSWD